MIIKINFESETPIYEQLKRQIVQGIARGQLKAGEDLPSVRRLAEDIGVNLHTVNKAYNILKDEGYLAIDRRRGTRVSKNIHKATDDYINKLEESLGYITSDAYCKGIGREEFLAMCEKYFDKYSKARKE